jgi:hypothetical protein
VVERVTKVKMTFLYQWSWESSCPERVADGGGADLMIWFQLERVDDRMKCYRKISRGSELILTPWKESVAQRGDVTISIEEEVAPERRKGGDNVR